MSAPISDPLNAPSSAHERVQVDVSGLPSTVFGHREVTWWATVGFMLVEGTTLAVVATSYLYLRINAAEWPPRPASAPELLVPTINLLVLLAAMFPLWRAGQAALRLDMAGVRRWMVIGTLVTLVATVLRGFEFAALNVRWDTNAYGSVLWAVYVAHTLLLATDLLESATITSIFFTDRVEPKHFTDVEDAAAYQYFLSLAWAVLYALVILGPRVL
jgi:cytochrome c oxidase subunit 3